MHVRSLFSGLRSGLRIWNKRLPFRHSIASMSDLSHIPQFTKEEEDKFGFEDFQGAMAYNQKTYGDVVRGPEGGLFGLNIYHPDLIQKVYENEGPHPSGLGAGLPLTERWAKDTGRKDTNLFLASGKKWRKLRTIFQKNMTNPKAAYTYYPVIDDVIDQAVQCMPANKDDMSTYMKYVSTDTFQTLALGRSLNLIDGSAKPSDTDWIDMVTGDLQRVSIELMSDGDEMQKVEDGEKSEKYDELVDLLERAMSHSDHLVDEAVSRLEDGDKNTLSSYVAHRIASMSEDGLNLKVIAENMVFFLLAAVDTTSNVMQVVLYNLATNPGAQETLREQIHETLGSDLHLREEHLPSIPYWRNVLKESYRLTPTVNISNRSLSEDIELGGYLIPKDTNMILTSIPYLWSPDVFDDPMKFDPTRWDRKTRDKKALAHHPYMLMPASKGKRMCVAIRTAEVEISSLFCRLLQTYRIKLADDSETLPENRTMAGRAPDGVKYIFEPLAK